MRDSGAKVKCQIKGQVKDSNTLLAYQASSTDFVLAIYISPKPSLSVFGCS